MTAVFQATFVAITYGLTYRISIFKITCEPMYWQFCYFLALLFKSGTQNNSQFAQLQHSRDVL